MIFNALRKNVCQLFVIALVFLTASCSEQRRTSVKNYQPHKAFVYSTNVVLNGNISKDEKKRLTADLDNYWDDSLKVAKQQKFGFFYVIKNPPLFDSVNIIRTKKFMNAYLNSQGYYYADFKDSIHPVESMDDQLRVSITMYVNIGKNITIDSTGYNMIDSGLQHLAIQNAKNSLLKKGEPYTKQVISNELDRLTNIYRQNGYYGLTREELYAEVDTTDDKLLKLSLDPFEQAKLLAEAAKNRKENPKWDVLIRERPIIDSSKILQYHIGKLYYYPETKITDIPDSLINRKGFKEFSYKELVMRYKEGKFVYRPMLEHTYLRNGNLYNDSLYYKSLNTLNKIGAWQQVDGRAIPRDKDTLDLHFFLVPELKQNYTIELTGSRNTGDISAGNLIGINTNFSYRNRNIWKQAIQSLTTLSLGTELNIDQPKSDTIGKKPLLQTFQISLSHSYSFPKLVVPFPQWHIWNGLSKLENKRTIFFASASYTDRRQLYLQRNFTTNWGYEWSKGNNTWLLKIPNVELNAIEKQDSLIKLIASNPFLQGAFKEGNVVGSSISLNKTFNSRKKNNHSHYIRMGFEESGFIANLVGNANRKIVSYKKIEAEYRYVDKYKKGELATRFFTGLVVPRQGEAVPFFKQYFLGGPNSMRAWGLRQLGLGSSILSDTTKSGYTDRFGDFAIEANIEYRFTIWNLSSFKIGSALYADIGNVWSIRKDPSDPGAEFSLARLGKDIAIGVGTGLRFDFSNFIVRLDVAYKVKDPARQYNNGWLDFNNLHLREKRINGLEINNLVFQLGIGLPF